MGMDSSADAVDLARDVPGLVRQKKGNQRGDVLGASDAAYERAAFRIAVEEFAGVDLAEEIVVDQAGRDRVHAYPVLAVLRRRDARQRKHPRLGGGIGRPVL